MIKRKGVADIPYGGKEELGLEARMEKILLGFRVYLENI